MLDIIAKPYALPMTEEEPKAQTYCGAVATVFIAFIVLSFFISSAISLTNRKDAEFSSVLLPNASLKSTYGPQ